MANKEHNNCLICNSPKLKTLERYEKHFLVKCKNCSFVFSKNIPTAEEISKCYEDYGRDDYLSPITIKRYNEWLDSLEKFRKTNKIIDVGCGIGYFLEQAKKRGWEVYGTEYTKEAYDICESKAINMSLGKLDPNNYEKGSFDVITSIEVIEHINNPQEELQNMYSLLRDGGAYYATTPNFNSFSRTILKEEWNIICYPEHISYYTPKTYDSILKQTGFKKEFMKSTGISLTRIKKSKNISDQEYISESSDDEKIRQAAENNILIKTIKNLINFTLSILGKGDTIKVLYTK